MVDLSGWADINSRCIRIDIVLQVHQGKARGIPEFVTEVSIPLDTIHINAHIATLGRQRTESEAQCVGTISRDAIWKFFYRGFLNGWFKMWLH